MAITFKKGWDWGCDSQLRMIIMPHIELGLKTETLLSLLHELGHIHYGHKNRQFMFVNANIMVEECEAWTHVIRCTKSKFHYEVMKLALKCLMTYREACIENGYIPLTVKEATDIIFERR